MANLFVSLNIVLPLFFLMALGWLLARGGLFDATVTGVMNVSVFKIFLPCMLFYNIYHTELSTAFHPRFLGFGILSLLVMFSVALCAIPLLERENPRRSVLMVSVFRSNYIIFGIPIVVAMFGQQNAGPASILGGIEVPIANILSVVVYESFRGGKIDLKKILKGIATNPLIIASALGILFLVIQIPLPQAIDKTVGDLAKLATPLALIFLGASMRGSRLSTNIRPLLIGVTGRLIFNPILFITAAILFGFRGAELAALVMLYSAPTAVSSFTMARMMNADSELAGQLVVFGTALSVPIMFLIILLLKTYGYA